MSDPRDKAQRISAVILAAGLSSCMELGPKLLLDVAGEPMIRRTVRNVLAIEPVETVVVTGWRSDEIEAALAGLPVRIVRNTAFRDGQTTSVTLGIRSLGRTCDAVLIMLGDQPLVTPDDLCSLTREFSALDKRSILVPHHAGMRGNPVILSSEHIPSVISGALKLGRQDLIATLPDAVAALEFDSDVFTTDCDTREDYEQLLKRMAPNG